MQKEKKIFHFFCETLKVKKKNLNVSNDAHR